jgi:hypothetical protein
MKDKRQTTNNKQQKLVDKDLQFFDELHGAKDNGSLLQQPQRQKRLFKRVTREHCSSVK